jgi:hypothetical protein
MDHIQSDNVVDIGDGLKISISGTIAVAYDNWRESTCENCGMEDYH